MSQDKNDGIIAIVVNLKHDRICAVLVSSKNSTIHRFWKCVCSSHSFFKKKSAHISEHVNIEHIRICACAFRYIWFYIQIIHQQTPSFQTRTHLRVSVQMSKAHFLWLIFRCNQTALRSLSQEWANINVEHMIASARECSDFENMASFVVNFLLQPVRIAAVVSVRISWR